MKSPIFHNALVVFEDKKIRREWHENQWYYSVVDVIQDLTSYNPRNDWSMLKKREVEHEIELSTNCVQLKLPFSDGKFYVTDCANAEAIFRIIQSIPSRKAEPFKRWLAKVGYERIQEIEDPELAQKRMKELYRDHMDNLELIFSMLGERVSTEITMKDDAQGYKEVQSAAKRGGKIAGNTRKETEKELGRSLTSKENYLTELQKKKKLGKK